MKTRRLFGSLLALLLCCSGVASAGTAQPRQPFDETEFNRFMADYPAASQWLTEKGQRYGGVNSPWVLSGMRYDRDFVKYLQEKGWNAERFFYLLDHINMGLLTSQAEARHDAMRARLDQQKEKMQTQMADSQKKWQEQMREQTRSSLETAQSQWSAQRARIANDPRIAPPDKQRILAQMDRAQPSLQNASATPEERQAQMQTQRQAWLTEQKQQIANNPTIPPPQKQEMIAQLDRAMAANAPQAPQPATPADPQAQQKQWLEARMAELRNNTWLHPAQKQQQLNQLQQMLDALHSAPPQNQDSQGLIPAQENTLIKNNRQKLTEMFFPEM
ncbi:MAG: hypothetical protein HQL88_04340 [Magnetococcales bacterium]|nr:hypothetical protein [Magnetococcales bacterium]